MEQNGKRPSPYRGFWAVLLALILTPGVFVFIIDYALNHFGAPSPALNGVTARAMGLGLGFVFHLMCMISGAFRPGWEAVKRRWADFFDNLIVGPGYALRALRDDMRDDGFTFAISMGIIATNFCFALRSLLQAIAMLS